MTLNPEAKPEVLVINNFFLNPDEVRQMALQTEKNADIRYFKGYRSAKLSGPMIDQIKARLEELLGEQFRELQSHFHTCEVTDPLVYHSDRQFWAGAVYLNPDAPLDCGTSFWRSKGSGLIRAPTTQDCQERGKTMKEMVDLTYGNALLDRTKWDLVDRVGNVYNRCVLWRGDLIHSSSGYFGHDASTQRLFLLLFLHK